MTILVPLRKIALLIFSFVSWSTLFASDTTGKAIHAFSLGDTTFLMDGKPFQIISGEMHYPRIPREAWHARMKAAKAMGLNTISTYVFWNVNEPEKGKFDFTGNNDVAAFVKAAQDEGLWVILRPSPYVCAEWEFGGYPYWLQNEKGLVVRSKEKQYIEEYRKYINEIGKQLAPMQINHGGNILLVQIENEYGSYGSDKDYLSLNEKMFRDAGFDGLLYTCDPPEAMRNGHLKGFLPGMNGLDKPRAVKDSINKYHDGKGPYFISEWYPAWFDWWGAPHHTVAAEGYAKRLDAVLSAGISINMYMFHGGTTRGFMNGANGQDNTPYEPEISSYDYDAPLDEAGNPTPKFIAFRSVIEKHLPKGETLPPVPATKPLMEIKNIHFDKAVSVRNLLSDATKSKEPMTFEALHQAYGFVLYRTIIGGGKSGLLKLKDLRDYAIVMVNGRREGILDRRFRQDSMQLSLPAGKDTLDIIVENLGRINFGPNLLHNLKGITEAVYFAGHELIGWQQYRLPFSNISAINYDKGLYGDGPVLRKGSFTLDSVADTYLDMRKWGKGGVWVNGRNLGRYWFVGPQQTIYLPAEWLKKGNNEIEILELLKPMQNQLEGIKAPVLNVVTKDIHIQ